jgi:hypothetical protein
MNYSEQIDKQECKPGGSAVVLSGKSGSPKQVVIEYTVVILISY